jgi:hypothetical protein
VLQVEEKFYIVQELFSGEKLKNLAEIINS